MVSWTERDGVDAEQATHRTYAGLKRHAESKGFKKARGWCAHKFRAIFGRWPNGEAIEDAAPADANLRWWIKQQGREYAKERKAKDVVSGVSVWSTDNVVFDDNMASSALMTEEDWGVKL